ncbi:MAG: hypothetical protein IPH35_27700 [Rhodoferax sp.]|nr:hypothetical protein [Rhodoferax sp.]
MGILRTDQDAMLGVVRLDFLSANGSAANPPDASVRVALTKKRSHGFAAGAM